MDRAIRRLGAFIMLLFCILFVQLNYIQVFRADDLNTSPTNSRPIDQAFSQPRGTVSTADGVIVAESVPIDTKKKFQRVFPEGDLYAAVTGYFNYSFGATGIERAYNAELSGRTAQQQVKSVGDLFVERDKSGDITLTMRSDVQQAAREALGEQRGTVVAIDPRTGGVIALWSYPSFDPNLMSSHDFDTAQQEKERYEEAPGNPLLAKAYREIYPPGSTYKVVTAATGVETGKVTPDDPSYPVIRALDVPQTTKDIPNFGGSACGGTLFTVLAKSCNTSLAQMGLDIGGPDMIDGAEAFGFNERPPFDLPAVASVFPDEDFSKQLPTLAQAAIGQGSVASTPLQMALVAAGIANDGVIYEPHVVDVVRDSDGDIVLENEPTVWKRPIGAQTADIMRQAMRGVVEGGTLTRLQIPGVDVGGKTGTAQFGASQPLRSHAWTIAFAGPPGQPPTIAVAVIVEGQEGLSEATGGRVAAPIVKRVIEASLKPMPSPPTTTTRAPSTTTPGGN
ncbi:MAG: penicillin-binding protein 2 [Aquihabitans sp.]